MSDLLTTLKQEHLDLFNIEPNIIGLYWANQDELIERLEESIKERKPYDELNHLSDDERIAFERGDLVF